MKVSDVMTRDVVTASPTMTLKQVASLLSERNIGGVPVVESDELLGIVSETDILFKERGPARATASSTGCSAATARPRRRRSPRRPSAMR